LLVTRDEIAARLWDRTHGLDIDQGINTAVRKARQALEPFPELLGTVVGKGYRFESDVIRVVSGTSAGGAAGHTTPTVGPPHAPAATRRPGRWSPWVVMVAVLVALAGGMAKWRTTRSRP